MHYLPSILNPQPTSTTPSSRLNPQSHQYHDSSSFLSNHNPPDRPLNHLFLRENKKHPMGNPTPETAHIYPNKGCRCCRRYNSLFLDTEAVSPFLDCGFLNRLLVLVVLFCHLDLLVPVCVLLHHALAVWYHL